MSDINVTVTNAGAAQVSVPNGSTVNTTVGNGGAVNVAIGTISPGNSTVVSGTVTIGKTTTLAAGSNATVVNNGTAFAAVLDFGIPTGAAGPAGATGPAGKDGVTPAFSIGTVSTLAAGSSANVTLTSTNNGANVTLDFGIPRGDPGTGGGSSNLSLSDGTPSNLGIASPGTSNLASRADHVHAVPSIAYADLTGLPSNFPSNIASVTGLQAALDSKSGTSHGHNYVTSLNNLTGSLTLAAGANVTITPSGSTLTIDSTSSGGIGANDPVDGGDYVGEILLGITFTQQPQSVTVNLGQVLTWSNGTNTPRYLLQSGNSAVGLQLTSSGLSANIASYSNIAAAADATTTVANLTLSSVSATVSLASNGTRSLIQIWQDHGGVNTETLRSDDGETWSRLTVPRPSRHIAAGALGWVADAYGDSGVAYTSADGLSWSARTLPFDPSVIYSPWRFAVGASAIVGVCGDSTRVARSANGVSWSAVTVGTSAFISRVAFGQGRFVAIGGSAGDSAFTSADGLTWTRSNLPTAGYDKIFFANGRFIALRAGSAGTDATTDAAMSTDGTTWAVQTLSASRLWRSAVYAGSYAISSYAGDTDESLTIASEPAAGSANLTVSAAASTGATVGYQWQRSTDAGTTWLNVANATSQLLTLSSVALPDNGTRYRVLATATGVPSATSQTAILTVTG